MHQDSSICKKWYLQILFYILILYLQIPLLLLTLNNVTLPHLPRRVMLIFVDDLQTTSWLRKNRTKTCISQTMSFCGQNLSAISLFVICLLFAKKIEWMRNYLALWSRKKTTAFLTITKLRLYLWWVCDWEISNHLPKEECPKNWKIWEINFCKWPCCNFLQE